MHWSSLKPSFNTERWVYLWSILRYQDHVSTAPLTLLKAMIGPLIPPLTWQVSEWLLLHGAPGPILCWAFPSILNGVARHWYLSLNPGSVHSFEQLNRSFADHFVNSRKQQKCSNYLHTIKQRERESIWSFISCLNVATFEVHNLDQLVSMLALMSNL